MIALVSLETLAETLVRKGLPVEYAERTAAELIDHRRDLVEELRASGLDANEADVEAARRLGEPRALVKKFTREYQRRYFCGRWRVLAFVLTPMLAVVLAWQFMAVVAVFGSRLTLNLASRLFAHDFSLATIATWKLALGMTTFVLVAPIALAMLYHRLAHRTGVGNAWAFTSIAQIALVTGAIRWSANYESGMAGFSMPFGVDGQGRIGFAPIFASQILQAAIPLVVLAAIVWRESRRRSEILGTTEFSGTLSA